MGVKKCHFLDIEKSSFCRILTANFFFDFFRKNRRFFEFFEFSRILQKMTLFAKFCTRDNPPCFGAFNHFLLKFHIFIKHVLHTGVPRNSRREFDSFLKIWTPKFTKILSKNTCFFEYLRRRIYKIVDFLQNFENFGCLRINTLIFDHFLDPGKHTFCKILQNFAKFDNFGQIFHKIHPMKPDETIENDRKNRVGTRGAHPGARRVSDGSHRHVSATPRGWNPPKHGLFEGAKWGSPGSDAGSTGEKSFTRHPCDNLFTRVKPDDTRENDVYNPGDTRVDTRGAPRGWRSVTGSF